MPQESETEKESRLGYKQWITQLPFPTYVAQDGPNVDRYLDSRL